MYNVKVHIHVFTDEYIHIQVKIYQCMNTNYMTICMYGYICKYRYVNNHPYRIYTYVYVHIWSAFPSNSET